MGEKPKRAGGVGIALWIGQEHAPAALSRIATWRPVPVQPGALDFADVIGARRQDPPPVLEVRWVHRVPGVSQVVEYSVSQLGELGGEELGGGGQRSV